MTYRYFGVCHHEHCGHDHVECSDAWRCAAALAVHQGVYHDCLNHQAATASPMPTVLCVVKKHYPSDSDVDAGNVFSFTVDTRVLEDACELRAFIMDYTGVDPEKVVPV